MRFLLRTPIAATLLAASLLAGCRGGGQPASDFEIDLSVSPTPPALGPARLGLTILGPDGEGVAGLTVEVEGTMTHAGMAPVLAEAQEAPGGRYVVATFDFNMAGDWVLIVRARHPDGRVGYREFPMRAVAPFPSGP